MFRPIVTRNLPKIGKLIISNRIERSVSRFCVLTALNTTNSILSSSNLSIKPISVDYCSDQPERKKKQKKNPPAVEHVGRLDLRIGKIVEVNKAPDADTLFLTKVDIGGEIFSIVAGMANYISSDDLLGRTVVVLCNLKASKLRGHLSEGMIMCAKNEDKLEPLQPPSNATPGDLVYCESYDRIPTEPPRDKKRLYDSLAPDMFINDSLIACYKGAYLYVPEKGNIVVASLKNACIQ